MSFFNHLPIWVYSFPWAFLVAADGNLRGSNTTSIQHNATTAAYKTDQLPNIHNIGATHPGEFKRKLNLYGNDDRQEYNDNSYPWCTIGKVQTSSGSCTGTMIGPSLMLTAQHCMSCNSDGTLGWMTFKPAYYDGDAPYGSAKATWFHWDYRIPCANMLSDSQFAFDYVVVQLDKRLGDKVGWMGYKTYETKWNDGDYWMHIGYGGGITNGQRPLFQTKSSIHTVQAYVNSAGTKSYLLTHTIDSTNGHSGGPIFGFWGEDGDPYIVGVQNSADHDAAGGPGLHTLISNLRSKYY